MVVQKLSNNNVTQEDIAKQILMAKKNDTEIENYCSGINWISDEYYSTWKRIKIKNISQLKKAPADKDLFFIAHNNDTISGKPMLVHETKQILPLIIETVKRGKDGEADIVSHKFIDDRYDKRYDGYQHDSLDKGFYTYKIVYKGDEYILLSEEALSNEFAVFKGMNIPMPGVSEVSRSLKFRSVANLFLLHSTESAIKVMPPEELVEYVKKLEWNLDDFMALTFLHPDGNVYSHTKAYSQIRISQLLSGKFEGYPLHEFCLGPPGTGKTMELEALDYKFNELRGILEAANSTPKALIPSFKEKPASPGYILNCNRLGLVDELCKMIANAMTTGNRGGEVMAGQLSQLNMLLEHKKRTIGSGNDNSIQAQATSKLLFMANPLPNKKTLHEHIGTIDPATLSRMLIFVQDKEELEYLDNQKIMGAKELGEGSADTYAKLYSEFLGGGVRGLSIREVFEGYIRSIYVSICDSCSVFISKVDKNELKKVYEKCLYLTKGKMKDIYKARGFHHLYLLLDGVVKMRCLFKDHDSKFEAKTEDYEILEGLMSRIVLSWDTYMSSEQDWEGGTL